MKKIVVAPSILGVPYENAPKIINELIKCNADIIHFDVMDGKFVPNSSFPIEEYKYIKRNVDSSIIFDVHLMVENVLEYVLLYIKNKADIITFHYEAVNKKEIKGLIEKIHNAKIKADISIKPDTDITVLDEFLDELDLVLVMSVEPGAGGQKFNESMLDKVEYLNQKRIDNEYHYVIEIDGGINKDTGKQSVNKGVDYLVAGSYILKSNDMKTAIKSLKDYE